MPAIIVKNYEFYSQAMGKHITSKRQYQEEMAKGGYVTFERAEEIAAKARRDNKKGYALSEKAKDIIATAKNSADRKGNVKLGDKAVDALKSMGMKFDKDLPRQYRNVNVGGFNG